MSDFISNISQFIENQFPAYMQSQGQEITQSERAVLIDFVEAYYEWLETEYSANSMQNRKMLENDNIDTTLDEYIKYFREKYLKDFPYVAATDERFLIKNIIDLYRTKGTPRSIELLIRMLFNRDANVYFPGQDIFRLSHSKWFEPKYLEVYHNTDNYNLINQEIRGTSSGAVAFVEGVVTKRVNGVLLDIIYISNIFGEFKTGDLILGKNISVPPQVIGSLTSVSVDFVQKTGNEVGDIFNVVSSYGEQGRVKVSEIYNTGRSTNFDIIDGGYGYTLDSLTDVYVSDTILYANNVLAENLELFEVLTQRNEIIAISNTSFDVSNTNGLAVSGISSSNTVVSMGYIVNTEESINTEFTVQVEPTGYTHDTFQNVLRINLNSDAFFNEEEIVKEGDTVLLTILTSNGTFSVGDIIYQQTKINDTTTSYNHGEISSSNSSVIEVTNSFGEWDVLEPIYNYMDTNADVIISDANTTYTGGTGTVMSQISNTEIVISTTDAGKFTTNNDLIGLTREGRASIASSSDESIVEVEIDGNRYDITPSETVRSFYTATLVDQSNTTLFLDTIQNTYYQVDNVSELNGSNGSIVIERADTGSGATFDIGGLKNESTVELSDILLGSLNVGNVAFMDLMINGENSTVYRVTAINVGWGGTGYANGEIVYVSSNGEYNTPTIPARGYITTNASGVIQSVTMIEEGEKYLTNSGTANVITSGGSAATFTIDFETGYGFDLNLNANETTPMKDAFNITEVEIGEIDFLSNVNLGSRYTNTPKTVLENRYIADAGIKDNVLKISVLGKSFKIGEVVEQATTGARGVVQSYSTITNNLNVRRISFKDEFEIGYNIVGETTGAIGSVNEVLSQNSSISMGENANVAISVVTSEGIVRTVRVVDSGYGYVDNESVTLKNGDVEITGTVNVSMQGVGEGYWKTFDSHPNSEKKIHDNYYWQEYSYDIQTPVSLSKYRNQIKSILHLAGTEFFGSVSKSSEKRINIEASTTVEIEAA